jgi:transposase
MLPASTRIFVCTEPVDLRKSFDGLAQCTREILECDPSSGAQFLFASKRATSLKARWWDKSGYCILYKRIARGVFRVPTAPSGAKSVPVDTRELALILERNRVTDAQVANEGCNQGRSRKSPACDRVVRY